jgi:hypothetical protein
MTQHDGGKGDTPRPLGVDKEKFDKNWDTIFKNGIPTLDELENQRDEELLKNIPFGK